MSGAKVSINVDLAPLQQLLSRTERSIKANARAIAQAGAQVYYDEVRANVARLGKKTGNLYNSVFQYFDPKRSGDGRVTYVVSWNHKKAPHGVNVEYGHMMYYRYYKDDAGKIRLMRQPGTEGMRKPSKNASRAVKDAYWVPRPDGPIQVAAHSFLRRAAYSSYVREQAIAAMRREIGYRLDTGANA